MCGATMGIEMTDRDGGETPVGTAQPEANSSFPAAMEELSQKACKEAKDQFWGGMQKVLTARERFFGTAGSRGELAKSINRLPGGRPVGADDLLGLSQKDWIPPKRNMLERILDGLDVKENSSSSAVKAARNSILNAHDQLVALGYSFEKAGNQQEGPRQSHVPSVAKKSGKMATELEKVYDHEAVPKRLNNGRTPYEGLSNQELRGIVNKTENPHEYLRAIRILSKYTQEALARKVSKGNTIDTTAIGQFERGKSIPTVDRINDIENAFKSSGFLEFVPGRLEDLVINARLSIIAFEENQFHERKSDNRRSIGSHYGALPKTFYEAQIKSFLTGDVPNVLWNDKIPPIKTKGDYARALRHVLEIPQISKDEDEGLATKDKNSAIKDQDFVVLETMAKREQYSPGESSKRIASLFNEKASADESFAQYWNEGEFDGLPFGNDIERKSPAASYVNRVADSNAGVPGARKFSMR